MRSKLPRRIGTIPSASDLLFTINSSRASCPSIRLSREVSLIRLALFSGDRESGQSFGVVRCPRPLGQIGQQGDFRLEAWLSRFHNRCPMPPVSQFRPVLPEVTTAVLRSQQF